MYAVIEYDDGYGEEWLFDTLEDAREFQSRKYAEKDPEIYWVRYFLEEVQQ